MQKYVINRTLPTIKTSLITINPHFQGEKIPDNCVIALSS
jgi:hypothetical protein